MWDFSTAELANELEDRFLFTNGIEMLSKRLLEALHAEIARELDRRDPN